MTTGGQGDDADRWIRASRWLLLFSAPVAAFLLFMPGVGLYLRQYAEPLIPGWMHPLRADHVSHFLGAAALTLLLIGARPLGRDRPWTGAAAAIGVVALLALVIEGGQILVGRGAEWNDVVLHEVGVAVAVGVWLIAVRRRGRARRAGR